MTDETKQDRLKRLFDLSRECELDGCSHAPVKGADYCCLDHEVEDGGWG